MVTMVGTHLRPVAADFLARHALSFEHRSLRVPSRRREGCCRTGGSIRASRGYDDRGPSCPAGVWQHVSADSAVRAPCHAAETRRGPATRMPHPVHRSTPRPAVHGRRSSVFPPRPSTRHLAHDLWPSLPIVLPWRSQLAATSLRPPNALPADPRGDAHARSFYVLRVSNITGITAGELRRFRLRLLADAVTF
jgi:hypothetical protein